MHDTDYMHSSKDEYPNSDNATMYKSHAVCTVNYNEGVIHTSELDRSEVDLNECERFLKANWDRSQIDPT